jgi:acyl-CoA hydrolase
MEVGEGVEAENIIAGEVRHTVPAYLSLVALDPGGKPMQVPPDLLESDGAKRENQEARNRRESRLNERRVAGRSKKD